MSDNLAHKLNATSSNIQSSTARANVDSFNSQSPQITLDRLKYQSNKPKSEDKPTSQPTTNQTTNTGKVANAAQQINRAKNIAAGALSGDIGTSAQETIGLGTQVGSQWLLTTLWGAVWLDWTLLSLLGLNIFLAFSLLLPNYVCQFGDDYLIGKWLPSRDLAKWTEIILLMIINMFILTIIITLIYIIYGITQLNWWDYLKIGASYATGGSEAAADAAIKSIK